MEIRREMSQQHSEKAPVTFHDVAACFSEEEWTLLHEWQKELYMNVMKDIHQALISLGPLIAASVFSLRTKENDDLGPMDNQDCERRHNIIHSTSDVVTNPDVYRMNREEPRHLKDPQEDAEGREQYDCLNPGFPFFNPDICLRKEEEGSASLMDYPGTEGGESSISHRSGHAVTSSCVSFHIKEEAETYSMDYRDNERKESISSPAGNTHANVDVLLKSQREKNLCSEIHEDVQATEMDESLSTDNPVIRTVFSLGHGCEEEMCSQELGPEGKATDDGKVNREREAEYSVACIKTTKANEKVPQSSVEKRIHIRSNRWPEPNQKQGETRTHWESGFRSLAYYNLDLPTPNIERPCGNDDSEKRLTMNMHPLGPQRSNTAPALKERPYQCGECEKSFRLKQHLMGHQKTHMEKITYLCTRCEKSFFQKAQFIIHQRTHTGERPYQCTDCGKRFNNKHNLMQHQRIHTGEKPYQCTKCKKSFSRKSNLTVHERTHM